MTRDSLSLQVECSTDYRGEQTPRCFSIGKRSIEILDIIDRWLAPDHRYFKVRGNDAGIYILRHDVTSNHWELTLYDARGIKLEE